MGVRTALDRVRSIREVRNQEDPEHRGLTLPQRGQRAAQQELERDNSVGWQVERPVNDALPALTEPFQNLVVRENIGQRLAFVALRRILLSLEIIRSLKEPLAQLESVNPDLARQLRRAAVSVSLNLSEGRRRVGKDRRHHWRIALGSLDEFPPVRRALVPILAA